MLILAEQMAADALEAMKLSRKFFVVELDFSLGSLDAFEEMFAQWQFALPGGNKPENVEKLVRVWGAYVGEVVRRSAGGEWLSEQGDHGERVSLHTPRVALLPHDLVRGRLTGQSAEKLSAAMLAAWE